MYEAFLVALWAALCGIDKYDVAGDAANLLI